MILCLGISPGGAWYNIGNVRHQTWVYCAYAFSYILYLLFWDIIVAVIIVALQCVFIVVLIIIILLYFLFLHCLKHNQADN